jgi:hypothetical protein
MLITRTPETFFFGGFDPGLTLDVDIDKEEVDIDFTLGNWGHSVTVYGYDPIKKAFNVYDNNYPTLLPTYSYDAASGFGEYSIDYGKTISLLGAEPFSAFITPNQFESFYRGAETGWREFKFKTVNITSPVPENDTITIEHTGHVTISGTVTGGAKSASAIAFYLDGSHLTGTAHIGSDGRFSFTFNNLTNDDHMVRMVVTDTPSNPWGTYAGFREIKLCSVPSCGNHCYLTAGREATLSPDAGCAGEGETRPGIGGDGCYECKSGYWTECQTQNKITITHDFDSLPNWSSVEDADWGQNAAWSIANTGQAGRSMTANRNARGSSARVVHYPITPHSTYTISIYMKCGSSPADYWAESAFKLGSNAAYNFDSDPGTWTMLQKFSRTNNGNNNNWVMYSRTFNSGDYTTISVGYKIGSLDNYAPVAFWDSLKIE